MNTLITEQARRHASAEGLTIAERVELACVAVTDTIELDHLKEWACTVCVRHVDTNIPVDSDPDSEALDWAYSVLEDCMADSGLYVEFNPNGFDGSAIYAIPERYADDFTEYFG